MFKKVIVAEDHASINEGLKSVLKELNITEVDVNRYCDDVLLKIKKAKQENAPYDLLITDLKFKEDYRTGKLKDGEDLLAALNREGIAIESMVFSQEDRIETVRRLLNKRNIQAYVVKGRRDNQEIRKALEAIKNNEHYLSESVSQALTKKSTFEITDYDIHLMQKLENGANQKEIAEEFKAEKRKPFSNSAIEKRIKHLKAYFKAKNAVQLIAKAKDLGLL